MKPLKIRIAKIPGMEALVDATLLFIRNNAPKLSPIEELLFELAKEARDPR